MREEVQGREESEGAPEDGVRRRQRRRRGRRGQVGGRPGGGAEGGGAPPKVRRLPEGLQERAAPARPHGVRARKAQTFPLLELPLLR